MNKKSRVLNNSVGNLLEEIKEQDINLDKYGATNLTVRPEPKTIGLGCGCFDSLTPNCSNTRNFIC